MSERQGLETMLYVLRQKLQRANAADASPGVQLDILDTILNLERRVAKMERRKGDRRSLLTRVRSDS